MKGQDFMDAEAATSLMHVTEALVDRHWQNENAIYNYVYPDTQDELCAYYTG
jgi:hypothetical protein